VRILLGICRVRGYFGIFYLVAIINANSVTIHALSIFTVEAFAFPWVRRFASVSMACM
jgi:hypothetical protein